MACSQLSKKKNPELSVTRLKGLWIPVCTKCRYFSDRNNFIHFENFHFPPASNKQRIKTRRFVTNGMLVQAVWHRILECFEIVVLFYFLILENTDLVSQADSHKLCSYRDKYACAPHLNMNSLLLLLGIFPVSGS